jgi:ubiquinone/menaquinone biosynthesis C-methylase UbiE
MTVSRVVKVVNETFQQKIAIPLDSGTVEMSPPGQEKEFLIPFQVETPDKSFDVVACYEILEHLPYEDFSKALSEIFRVSKSYAILSLPDAGRVYRIYIQIPKIGIFKKLISLPRIQNPIHKFDGEHYWEIGKAGYSLSKITKDIKEAGFKILKTYRIFENPYHRFFVLKKEKQLNEKN